MIIDLDAPPDAQIVNGHAGKTDWADPEDMGRFGKRARRIEGYRRVWTIDSLHRINPREITAEHVKAASRLLTDHELGEGARIGSAPERVDHSGAPDFPASQIDALTRLRHAADALGPAGWRIVTRVVCHNFTLAALAQWLPSTSDQARGRLIAGLDRLVEHYTPPTKRAPVVVIEVELGTERLGRWRHNQGA